MSSYYIQPLDPQEMASRFSTKDSLEPIPQVDSTWRDLHLDKIIAVLDRLPEREADLIRLYFFRNKRQTDIAEIFNVTQAAVSYRLQRALNRIRFLIEIPDVSKERIYKDLTEYLMELDARIFSEMFESTCQSEVAAILNISQGRVRHRFIANLERLGDILMTRICAWGEGLEELSPLAEEILDEVMEIQAARSTLPIEEVEVRLKAVVKQMREVEEEDRDATLFLFAEYYHTFAIIRYHFNILREIRLPKWANRPTHSLV